MRKALVNVLTAGILLGVSALAVCNVETDVFSQQAANSTMAPDDTIVLNGWEFTGSSRSSPPPKSDPPPKSTNNTKPTKPTKNTDHKSPSKGKR